MLVSNSAANVSLIFRTWSSSSSNRWGSTVFRGEVWVAISCFNSDSFLVMPAVPLCSCSETSFCFLMAALRLCLERVEPRDRVSSRSASPAVVAALSSPSVWQLSSSPALLPITITARGSQANTSRSYGNGLSQNGSLEPKCKLKSKTYK